jgi:hypothetical protein
LYTKNKLAFGTVDFLKSALAWKKAPVPFVFTDAGDDVYVFVPVNATDLPVPLLSLHAVTGDVPVMDVVSAASNQSCKPGMDCGENPHTDFCDAAVANDMPCFLFSLEQNIPRNCRSIHS